MSARALEAPNTELTRLVREYIRRRMSRGAMQIDVAKELGITAGYVRQILYEDQGFSFPTALKLLRAIGVRFGEFEKKLDGILK